MSAWTNERLILLSTFIYLRDFEIYEHLNLGESVEYMISGGLERNRNTADRSFGTIGEYPGGMNTQEWHHILNIMKADPVLMAAKIVNYKEISATGMKAMVFSLDESSRENVVLVFKGTTTDYEWYDNGQIGYEVSTFGHEEAMEYLNHLIDDGYRDIVVCGHSKGGNRAHYLGLLNDEVKFALSINGPGFSAAFKEKYSDKIAKNEHKLLKISSKWDPVNAMYFSFGRSIYIDTKCMYHINALARHHFMSGLLDDEGKLKEECEQSLLQRLLYETTKHSSEGLSYENHKAIMDLVVQNFQTDYKVYSENNDLIWDVIKENATEYAGKFIDLVDSRFRNGF